MVKLSQAEREDLKRAFDRFRTNHRLPRTPVARTEGLEELDELDALKGAVVLYGTEVAGPILSIIKGSVPRHSLERNDELRRRIERLVRHGSPRAAAEAAEHAEYVDELHGLIGRVTGYARKAS